MSAAQRIIASLNIPVSDKELVSLLNKHLTAADEVVKSGKLVDPTIRLAVIVPGPGFPLQLKFIPGPGGHSDNPASTWGGGAFQSEQEAPSLGTYRLVIEDEEARLFDGELEVWFGLGKQTGMDGEWFVTLDQP